MSPDALMLLEPIFHPDGSLDGTFVWCNDAARLLAPSIRVGGLASDLFTRPLSAIPSTEAALAAWQHPGELQRTPMFSLVIGEVTRWFDVTAVRTNDLILLTFADRSEEETSRQQIAASEQRFRELLESLDAGVVLLRPIWDPPGAPASAEFHDAEIVWTNNASTRMWRDQEGLAPGTRVAGVYYDLDDWLVAANAAWSGTPQSRILTPDPSVALWTSAVESLRRVGDLIVEFTFDRSNDQQLLDQIAALDQRYQSLVEDLPLTVMVARTDRDELVFVSPNATQLTGYPLDQLSRLSRWDELIIDQDRRLRNELGAALMSGANFYEGQWRFRRRTGDIVHVSVRAIRRRHADGDEVVALVTDITDQRRLMERVAISDRLETLGRTAGSIAHDFNNLLMIVNGNIDRARVRLNQPPELDIAARAGSRAAKLANSLLAFASGRPGEPMALSVRTVIDDIKPIIRGSLPDTAVMRIELPEGLPTIWADASHLEQVLMNITANSRSAMGEFGTLTIKASATSTPRCHLHDELPTSQQAWVLLEVSDTGVGIEPDAIARVWEPFYTTHRNEPDASAGLGMSTVHGIVHQYGGHVLLASEVGVGTTVSVYLPAHSTAA